MGKKNAQALRITWAYDFKVAVKSELFKRRLGLRHYDSRGVDGIDQV